MSKTEAECNKIFKLEWTEKQTNTTFSLYMIPGFDADLSSPDTVLLPEGIIRKLEYSWKWNNGLYYGNRRLPKLSITFDLKALKNEDKFKTFAKLLYESCDYCSENMKTDLGTSDDIYYKFEISNLFILILDDAEPIFVGSQKRVESANIQNDELSVEAVDLLKSATDKINTNHLSELRYYDDGGVRPTYKHLFYIEQLYGDPISPAFSRLWTKANISQHKKNDKIRQLWFKSLYCVLQFIEIYIQKYARKTARQSISIGLEKSFPANTARYYKQTYDGTASVGSQLGTNELYMLAYVMDYSRFSGYKVEGGAIEYLKDNFETITDFLNHWSLQLGCYLNDDWSLSGGGGIDTLSGSYTYENLTLSDEATLNEGRLMNEKIKPLENFLTNVRAQPIEAKGDDIEEIELVDAWNLSGFDLDFQKRLRYNAPPNADELEASVIFTNTPVAFDNYETQEAGEVMFKAPAEGGFLEEKLLEKNGGVGISKQIHELGLFYRDLPMRTVDGNDYYLTSAGSSEPDKMIRIHECCALDLGQFSSPDFATGGSLLTTDINRENLPYKQGDIDGIIKTQENCSILTVIMMAYVRLFRQQYQNGVEFQKYWEDSDFYLLKATKDITIPYTLKEPQATMFESLNNHYKVIDFKMKIVNENPNDNCICEIKALSKPNV